MIQKYSGKYPNLYSKYYEFNPETAVLLDRLWENLLQLIPNIEIPGTSFAEDEHNKIYVTWYNNKWEAKITVEVDPTESGQEYYWYGRSGEFEECYGTNKFFPYPPFPIVEILKGINSGN